MPFAIDMIRGAVCLLAFLFPTVRTQNCLGQKPCARQALVGFKIERTKKLDENHETR